MNLRTLAVAFALVAVSFGARSQEILEEPGPYVPLGQDVTDISVMISEGRISEALDSIDVLMAADSLDDALYYYRGQCLIELNKYGEAAAAFKRALELDPDNSSYYERLYSLYDAMRLEEAADSLAMEMAVRFPRKFRTPYLLMRLGNRAWLTEHNDSLALRYYEEALAIDGEYPAALYGKAEVSRNMGNLLGYYSTVEAIVRSSLLSADVKSSYLDRVIERLDGPTYRIWGKQIDGIMDTFAEIHPTDSCSLVSAGRWFYSTGEKEKGKAYFRRWRDTNPDNYHAATLCISVLMQEGEDAEVIKACDEALARFKDPKARGELYCIKADNLHKIGRKTKSFIAYEKALKADPDNLMAANNYAYFLSLEKRNLKKAEKLARKAVEGEPDNVSYLDTYGYILYLLKRSDEAVNYFKRAIMFGGKEDEAVLRHYYLVLEALGKKELALYYKSLYEAKALQK